MGTYETQVKQLRTDAESLTEEYDLSGQIEARIAQLERAVLCGWVEPHEIAEEIMEIECQMAEVQM